eukprot:6895286-Lingulodinium_polyedra.AAC.1
MFRARAGQRGPWFRSFAVFIVARAGEFRSMRGAALGRAGSTVQVRAKRGVLQLGTGNIGEHWIARIKLR